MMETVLGLKPRCMWTSWAGYRGQRAMQGAVLVSSFKSCLTANTVMGNVLEPSMI